MFFFLSLVGKLLLVAKWKLKVVLVMMPNIECTRLTDVLVPNWVLGKSATFDIPVTSPLTPITLHEASVTIGSMAQVAENRMHVLGAGVGGCAFGSFGLWLLWPSCSYLPAY